MRSTESIKARACLCRERTCVSTSTIGALYIIASLYPTLARGQEFEEASKPLASAPASNTSATLRSASPVVLQDKTSHSRESVSTENQGDLSEQQARWYGFQTLIADGISVALVASATATKKPVIALVGLFGVSGYILATPIIHLSHTNYWTSASSFGIRAAALGLIIIGGLMTLSLCFDEADSSSSGCGNDGDDKTGEALTLTGLIVGLGVIPLDAVLARDTRPQSGPTLRTWADRRRRAVGLSFAMPIP